MPVEEGLVVPTVLVRQRLTALSAEERRGFADAANRPATLAMSAPERAMADARLVTPDSLDLIRNANDLGAAANRDFVRTFTARLPQAERGAMATAEGGLSAEGLARVRNAVLAKAYDHAGVLSRIAEATSDEIKSISNALVAAAPDWAKLRADIARGAVREDVDLTGELLEAVARTADLRAKGVKLDTFLAQQDAFDRLPRPVEAFMRMFTDERGRRAAGTPVVAERLRTYATEARKVLADQGLDLGMPRVSADDIQAAAARRGQRAPEAEGALLFSRRRPTDPRAISFFDRVAESLRSAEPIADTRRAGEAANFLHGLGIEMADRAGREGAEATGSTLDRLAAAEPDASSFLGQLGQAARAEAAEAARLARPAPDILVGPEARLVEAASRLHGTPAERVIALDELRAALPGLSPAELDHTLAALRAGGVARVTERGVSLDHAGLRRVQAATERYVRGEAEDVGKVLFGPRGGEAYSAGTDADLLFRRRAGEPTPRRLTFDSPIAGERRVTRAQVERELIDRSAQAEGLRAEGEMARADRIQAEADALTALLPKFDADLPRGRPFAKARTIEAGEARVVRVQERGEDERTYRIFERGEDGKPGRALGYADMARNPDGRWETAMLHVEPGARGRGLATALYEAAERDIGAPRAPSGILLPDGYAFWKARDPEAVRFHQHVTEGGQDQWMSPKRLIGAIEAAEPGSAERAALRRLLDRVPPEGRTPEALAVQFRRRGSPAGAVEEPDQIRQGRPVEDQGTAPVEGDTRPARLEDLGRQLAADFETVLRTGGVRPGAAGQFDTRTGVARVRSLSDLDVVLHEVGHKAQQSAQTGRFLDPVIARNRAELAPLGAGTGKVGDAEAFAELFRLYAVNRAYAERTYPGAAADLDRTLRAEMPAQAAALDRLRGELDVIHGADSGAVVGSDVITPKPDGLFRRILDLFGTDFIGAAAVDPRGGVFYAWRDALYTHLLSPHHPINRAKDALGRVYRDTTGKSLDLLPQDDPYILARLSSGARATADSMLTHGVRGARSDEASGPSFRDAIEAAIGKRYTAQQWHDFGAYLTARSMVADYERFAAGEIPNPPGKLSASDYARAVTEFEAKYPTFADGAEKMYAFQRNHEQRIFDLGLTTKAYHDAAQSRRDYVPKMRDMEDLGGGGGGTGRRDGASVMKAFRGSQRSVTNPLDAIFARVHDLEQAAALNETKAALARLAEIAGPGSGFIAEPVPANKLSPVRVDVVDALRAAGSKANVDSLDLGALIHQAEGLLGDDVFAHIFRAEPIRPGREPITFYYVNGERRALRLADGAFGRELYTALNAMTQPERNIFLSVLQISGQLLRTGVTKSIGFVYRNFTRDQGTSVGTGARGYVPFYSALKGGFDAVRGGGDFERYLSFGGFGGGALLESIESSALARGGAQRMFRQKNIVSRALGAGAKLAELSEAATRAGQFQSYTKQARDLGFDAYNAALYATFKTNDYIDFRKVGSHIAPFARAIPFLNASAQGTDREARALVGDMVRLEAKRARGEELSRIELDTLKDSRAAWVKTLAWGFLFGAVPAYLNSENPEWFGAAEWRRERGYNLMPLGPAGHWLTMFKPFGFIRNISDLMEYGTEYLMRRDPRLGGKLARALAEAHHLPYTNPILDTFYNTRANYDPFRQRPIVSPSMQALPAAEQYTRYTSEIAKGIGQATGWSPMKVDYAARNLGGTIAQDFLANSSTFIKWMQGQPGGKEKTIWDLPLMRELTQNLAVGSEATERFYKLVGERVGTLEQSASAYGQKIRAGDRTGAADYLRGLPEPERAYATLTKQGFDASEKLMHPLVLARATNAVIGGVSRAIGDRNLLPEGDLDRSNLTLSRRDAKPIEISGPVAEKLRTELDALSMVTARNALIAYGADGMEGVPVKDPGEFLDRIRLLSPAVARELRGRLAAKRLYDPGVVAERWPETRARLLRDGENADLTDLLPRRPKKGERERRRVLDEERVPSDE